MERDVNVVSDTEVRFFTPHFYAFDNFSAYTVEVWGKKFPTVEHAYQWKKYEESNPQLAREIFDAANPSAVKKISDAHTKEILPAWHDKKVEIMEEILRAKTQQHEKVRKLLVESGTRTIIENSPTDSFWGIGPHGDGKNMVGKIWMKIRNELI